VSWSDADCDHIEETLQSDGFSLIFGFFQKREVEIIDALTRKSTTWEDTLRLRGELEGVRRIARIRSNYPSKSEKP
jgi:hypothetical protein